MARTAGRFSLHAVLKECSDVTPWGRADFFPACTQVAGHRIRNKEGDYLNDMAISATCT